LTTRVQARHRAAVRARTPLTDVSDTVARTAGGAARTGAVAVAASGLLVSIALPAGAAPATVETAVTAAVGSTVPAAFGTTAVGVVSAPATAASTATAVTFASAPAAAPVVVAPVIDRASRTSDSVPVVNSSVAVADPAPVAAPVAEVAAPAPAAVPLGQQILAVADDYAGVPYVYGGTTPSGFDCSGYTSYVYRQVGVEIPRTSNAQLQASARISREQAVPGDLVFFTNSGGRAYHVGIYAGDNMMWDAPRSGKPVQLRAIWSDAVTFGRLAPTV